MLQCLTGAVGVTLSDCDCIINGLTPDQLTEIRRSASGLYLDDLEGGVHMKALKSVDACKTFYSMSTAALANAGKWVEDDLILAINSKYEKAKRAFVGDIGRMSYATTLNDTGRYQGVRIEPWGFSDGLITLNRIAVAVNSTAEFTIKVLRVPVGSVMGDVVGSYPVEATANAWLLHSLTTPLKMPLVYHGQLVEYWVIMDTLEAGPQFLPKDNKVECSTCESNNPQRVREFVKTSGVSFGSLTALDQVRTDPNAHGFSLSVAIKCDNETLFCREYQEDDAVAVTMAHAMRYKAGELLIEDVQKSPDVNRYTTMAKEYLWGKRNHFKKEYETRIAYLAHVINIDASNCYVCRETTNQPFTAGIFK